jgi:hypothetical protein
VRTEVGVVLESALDSAADWSAQNSAERRSTAVAAKTLQLRFDEDLCP